MPSINALGINTNPAFADAAFQQQAGTAAADTGLQATRLRQLYSGYQGVEGSAQKVAETEGAQGNLYSGGAQQAEQANKQDYAYNAGQLWQGLRNNLANLASQRFFAAVGSNA